MARHPFAKKVKKHIAAAYEDSVFALNIPMSDKEREELKSLYLRAIEIIDKY